MSVCGIAGQFETRLIRAPDPGILARMAAAIAHRGPDDQGIECGEHWGIASRRLAIIGVDGGHQPLSNEDGSIWAVFNGEIYNHWDLRDQLGQKGHIFSSATDTEVLVHLYEEFGDAMVDHLAGMFAFAIVDVPERRLLLARDRLGQKPLFYTIGREGTLAFASELAALQEVPGLERNMDLSALSDYLTLGYIPAPKTIYKSVRKLPPASILAVSFLAPEAQLKRYWRPCFEPKDRLSFRDATEQTELLLQQAVSRRLEAEVPLGAFLSGGIDSSAIVALMQELLDEPVKTFTVGFSQPRYDEREYAELAARHIGTEHAAETAEPRDVDLLRHIIRHCGEPYCDASILPTALLSRFTRGSVTVALSGDGGDELFGGYERYRVMALHRLLSVIPLSARRTVCNALLALLPNNKAQRTLLATMRRLLQAAGQDALPAYAGFQGIFSAEARAALMTATPETDGIGSRTEVWRKMIEGGSSLDAVERFLELDMLEYLPGDLLTKVDIASMMFSLEVRSPFLDHDLVDAVCRLPRSFKVGLLGRKRLLRAAVGKRLPRVVVTRPKRGFGVPVSEWLRQELGDMVREMVVWQRDWDPEGFFDHDALQIMAEEHLNGYADHGTRLWALLCFWLWRQEVP